MTEGPQPQEGSQEPQKGIWSTLKDNAALLAAILGLFGVVISSAVNTYISNNDQEAQRELEATNAKRQRELEAFNATKQRELEQEKAQNAALQTYLDQMGQMLSNQDLRSSEKGSGLRTLARARTLAVFEQASPEGKSIALQFLSEANLVQGSPGTSPVISLELANLSGINVPIADLNGANLYVADLTDADLTDADLRSADLTQADLVRADLRSGDLRSADLITANLSDANLSDALLIEADLSGGTDLSDADLSGAYLSGAYMNAADLSGADLSGADLNQADLTGTDLSAANLSKATWVTDAQLDQARSLQGATMPDGQTPKSEDNLNGPTFEEWLKSKGGGEEGEKSGAS